MANEEIISKYKTVIFNEFIKCCQSLTIDEQIHFTDIILKILPLIYHNEADEQIDFIIEQELYKKYRHKMRFFSSSGFINLFFKSSIPAPLQDPQSHDEFFIIIYSLFEDVKTFLYIAEPDSTGLSKVTNETEKFLSAPMTVVKHKSFDTRPQQVLLMYYITKGLGIKAKIEIPVSKIAMFYHSLLGWEYNDINNTGIYKLLKRAPYIQTNKKLFYQDLSWVRAQIELLGLIDVLELIDKELKEVKKHLE
jgi:hypothetical protein